MPAILDLAPHTALEFEVTAIAAFEGAGTVLRWPPARSGVPRWR
jgi:hypothetical protein